MGRVWYCATCGYEVGSRGRCHSCRRRLVASPLAELEPGSEEEEVGYRLEGWTDEARVRLIEELIDSEILHRFEEDELIVAAEDEGRVDDLMEELTVELAAGAGGFEEAEADPSQLAALLKAAGLLRSAAARLRRDPTDMEADSDVAEASGTIFLTEAVLGEDPETWAAVGRVTRRLLAALGAEEALEDEIRTQASILYELLASYDLGSDGSQGGRATARASGPLASGGEEPPDEGEAEADAPKGDGEGHFGTGGPESNGEGQGEVPGETVYELPEWLPEQRAHLSVLLSDAGVAYRWEGEDLVVPEAAEEAAEALFEQVEGLPGEEEDDEARYRSLEELFAAADRLVNDPEDEQKAAEVVSAVQEADGPTPVGLDDVQWWQVRSRARSLAASIEAKAPLGEVIDKATAVRDLLRALL